MTPVTNNSPLPDDHPFVVDTDPFSPAPDPLPTTELEKMHFIFSAFGMSNEGLQTLLTTDFFQVLTFAKLKCTPLYQHIKTLDKDNAEEFSNGLSLDNLLV